MALSPSGLESFSSASGSERNVGLLCTDDDDIYACLPDLIQNGFRGLVVGDERMNPAQRANRHAAPGFKLRRIGKDNELVGAAQKLGFGPRNQRVALDHAQRAKGKAAHEHFGRRVMLGRIAIKGRQHNALLTVDFTSRHDDTVFAVRHKGFGNRK